MIEPNDLLFVGGAGSILEDPKEIPLTTYSHALKLAKRYEMNDVTQAILAVVLKEDSKASGPINLTQSFERYTFAVGHSDVVPSDVAIKHLGDICRAGADPELHHLEMLNSDLKAILQIMNGRVWVRTNLRNQGNQDCPDPTVYAGWNRLMKG